MLRAKMGYTVSMKKKTIIGIGVFILGGIIAVLVTGNNNQQEVPLRNDAQEAEGYRAHKNLEDGNYKVQSNTSELHWYSKSLVVSHDGTIAIKDGELKVESGELGGHIVFDMQSIQSDAGAHLDNDLKSDNFFSADTFPESILTINRYSSGTLEGDLTIRGITQAVSFPLVISASEKGEIIISGDISFDRTLWDINYRSQTFFQNLGNKVIDDEVKLKVQVVATAK